MKDQTVTLPQVFLKHVVEEPGVVQVRAISRSPFAI